MAGYIDTYAELPPFFSGAARFVFGSLIGLYSCPMEQHRGLDSSQFLF